MSANYPRPLPPPPPVVEAADRQRVERTAARDARRQTATALDPNLLLEALHPADPATCFTITGIAAAGGVSVEFVSSPTEAAEARDRLDAAGRFQGVFHLVPTLGVRPERGRGKEADAVACRAVYADIDALECEPLAERVEALRRGGKKGDAKGEVWDAASPADRALALANARAQINLAVLDGEVPPPSAVVHSGRGFHPYWLLDEAATGDALRNVKTVNKAFARFLRADSCYDLARVLRTPGTWHRKNPADPLRCELVEFHDDRRYRLDDLMTFAAKADLDLLEVDADADRTRRAAPVQIADTFPVREVPVPDAWKIHLASSEHAAKTWHGERTNLKDVSRSTYGFTIMLFAARDAWIRDVNELLAVAAACPSCAGWVDEKYDSARRTALKVLGIAEEARRGLDFRFTHGGVPAGPAAPPPSEDDLLALPPGALDVGPGWQRAVRRRLRFDENARAFALTVCHNDLRNTGDPTKAHAHRESLRNRRKNICTCKAYTKDALFTREYCKCGHPDSCKRVHMETCSNTTLCPHCGGEYAARCAEHLLNDGQYAGYASRFDGETCGAGVFLVIADLGGDGMPSDQHRRVRRLRQRYGLKRRWFEGLRRVGFLSSAWRHARLVEALEREGIAHEVYTFDPRTDPRAKLVEAAQAVADVMGEPSGAFVALSVARDAAALLDLVDAFDGARRTDGPRHDDTLTFYSEVRDRREAEDEREAKGLPRKWSDHCAAPKLDANGQKVLAPDGTPVPCGRPLGYEAYVGKEVLVRGEPGVPRWRVVGQAFGLLTHRILMPLADPDPSIVFVHASKVPSSFDRASDDALPPPPPPPAHLLLSVP